MKKILIISSLFLFSCHKESKDYSHWSDSTKLKHEQLKIQIDKEIEEQLKNQK